MWETDMSGENSKLWQGETNVLFRKTKKTKHTKKPRVG